MTELFNNLTAVGDVISEENSVVYLLASLPDSFEAIGTAFDVNKQVKKMEIVADRLLHAKRMYRRKDRC